MAVGFFDTSGTVISPQKDALESAARKVDHHINLDNSHTELIDRLKMGGELPAVSGLSDNDYPGVAELGINFQPLAQLNLAKKIPLPMELIEQFRLMQGGCQMGLFPEIGRAWLTIDSNIFLWSFHDGSDLAYFDGINDSILCVGLSKPKPGVFQDFIHYLLCLATPVEIVLLGVSFSQQSEDSSPFEEMHLFPEPLFSYPTDNTFMSTFASTENGRIFLGGQDSCLYEFTYQARVGWFTRKCRKINHSSSALSFLVPSFLQFTFAESDPIVELAVDNSRNILYARTEKGSIQVFDLGEDGDQMSKVAGIHYQTLSNLASAIAKTIDKKYFYPIVYISAIEANESRDVHLVAVMQSGVRLYFTTNLDGGKYRPNTLAMLHVRLPPGFSANSAMDRPSNIHLSLYSKGFSVMIAGMYEDHDVLVTTDSDSFIFHPSLIEMHTSMHLDSHVWALCEIPSSSSRPKIKTSSSDSPASTDPPLMITQHVELSRKFLLLSNQGCSIFTKPRPVDQLASLLSENRGPDCDAVKAFFKLHTESQACAMCLILCCSHSPQDKQVAEHAMRAFFLFGGSPMITPVPTDTTNPADTQLSTTSQSMYQKPAVWSSTPAQREQSLSPAFPQPNFSSVYSPVKSVSTSPQNIGSQNVSSYSQSLLDSSTTQPQRSALRSSVLTSVRNPAQVTFQQIPAQSQATPTSSLIRSLDQTEIPSEIVYSGKHNGLYFYFSRIMRPLWNLKLVTEQTTTFEDTVTTFASSNVTSEELSSFLLQLSSLKDFISHHLLHFLSVGNTSSSSMFSQSLTMQTRNLQNQTSSLYPSKQKKTQTDAELQERSSLSHLQQLVNYTYELLGLWKVLCDHQFESIVSFLSLDHRDQLKQMMFKDFIVDGQELGASLASAVINIYLEDNTSTNSISVKLREVCPSIYRVEDATMSKVYETVMHARTIINRSELESKLFEALKLCKEVCPNFDLAALCSLFQEVQFYQGIVDISLCTAQRLDPQKLALHFYKNGEPSNDQQGQQAFTNRRNCYKVIINIMNDLVSASVAETQRSSVPPSPGAQPTSQSTVITPDEAKQHSEAVFELCLKTDDELFHSSLYDWLFETGKTDTLLSISSHFLESYLKRRTTMYSDSLQSFDLLWKFYEKNQNFGAAAKVLSLLADKEDASIKLPQRLEYLSRAIICIKSSEMRIATRGEGEFLHELEEKMEVARIQLQILETLQQKKLPGIQDSLNKLNSNFLTIGSMFEDFAQPFDLPESKLAIFHCAGHYDPSLIESFWQGIIDKEFEVTCGSLPEVRINILKQKIQSLSQLYISSEKYFPMGFIIKYLELKTCILNFDTAWVYRTLMSVGKNVVEIWSVYHKLYRSKDTCWHAVKKPLHLSQVLSIMIKEFSDAPSILPATERRAFVTLCLDAIAGYLVDLQAMNVDPNVTRLMYKFQTTQHTLERLLL